MRTGFLQRYRVGMTCTGTRAAGGADPSCGDISERCMGPSSMMHDLTAPGEALTMSKDQRGASLPAPISVVIPTYNAERTLADCLRSLVWVDEVLIVDMFSTDRTLDICESFRNTRVYQRIDYIFANVNFGMDCARNEWVIRHDSDEMITPELRDEILAMFADGRIHEHDGYYVAELINHFGIWSRNSANVTGREKLFRKGFARYEVKGEHEHPTIKGRWSFLQNVYLHDSNPSLPYMLKKFIYYAERDAERADLSRPKSAWYIAYRTIKAFFSSSVRIRARSGPLERGLNPILAMSWAFKHFVQEAFIWERLLQAEQGRSPDGTRQFVREFGCAVGREGPVDGRLYQRGIHPSGRVAE
jgi:glycosyltransferase involved in cell wall biosynthesis